MSFYDLPEHLTKLAEKGGTEYWTAVGHYMLTEGYDFGLTSRVMDVGGYKGDFAGHIYDRYGCQIDIYEPVKVFYNGIKDRFTGFPTISVHNYGLEDRDYCGPIAGMNEGSSMFYPCDVDAERVNIHDIAKEIETDIDLLALNGEGCEFPILERLIQTDLIASIKNLVIQFHVFVPDAERRRNEIRNALRKTHKEKFCYDFCWEAWSEK